jgi:organic radical activating enzyme
MKKLIKLEKTPAPLYVYWQLTDFCNQACYYCDPAVHAGLIATGQLPGALSNDEIITTCDRLNSMSITDKDIVTLSGGEPTVHTMLPEIIQRLTNKFKIELITNGSRAVSWWKSLPVLPDEVIITLHPEYYDDRQFRINDLVKFLKEKNTNVLFNLMCDGKNWDKVVAMYNNVDDDYKRYVIPKIITGIHQMALTNEQQEFVNYLLENLKLDFDNNSIKMRAYYDDGSVEKVINTNSFISNRENYFKGWSCSAGSQGINIGFSGKVWAGICQIEHLGRATNFNLKSENIICNKFVCGCPADVALPKFDLNHN